MGKLQKLSLSKQSETNKQTSTAFVTVHHQGYFYCYGI